MHTLSYRNTTWEVIVFQVVSYARSTWTYVLLAILFLLGIPGATSGLPADSGLTEAAVVVILTQLLTIGSAIAAGLVFVAASSFVLVRGKGGQEHTVSIDQQCIVERTDTDETTSRWAGIHRVRRTKNSILIYTNPLAAHIVPRHAVEGDWDEFCRAVMTYWQQARV